MVVIKFIIALSIAFLYCYFQIKMSIILWHIVKIVN